MTLMRSYERNSDFRHANEVSGRDPSGAMEDIRRNARWWAEHPQEQALAWYRRRFADG